MKDFLKLPSVISGETCSEAKSHIGGLNKIYFTAAQIFNNQSGDIPRVK